MDLFNFIFYLLILLLSLFILGKSAVFLVTAITRIGVILRLSQFLTGFILLGIATSTPEISVAINSTLANNPQLSLGNLLGANVVLLTFITGLAAVISNGVKIHQELSQPSRLIQIALLVTAPLPLLLDSNLSRTDGLFLMLLYLVYLIYVYRQRPNSSPPLTENLLNYKIINTLALLATGSIGIFLGAKAVVFTSLQLAEILKIPTLAVGLLVLSIGTNIPEISITLAALKKHHTNLIFGDVLGSAASNTLIIALIALVSPFKITTWAAYQTTSIFLVFALFLFFTFTRSKKFLSRLEGFFLLSLYVAFVTSELISAYLNP